MKRSWILFVLMAIAGIIINAHHVYADNDGIDVRRSVIYGVSIEVRHWQIQVGMGDGTPVFGKVHLLPL